MARTLDYWCARVEEAEAEFLRNPRALNLLLDAIDKMRFERNKYKQDKTEEKELF